MHDVPISGGGSGQPVVFARQDHAAPASLVGQEGAVPVQGLHRTQAHWPTSYLQIVPMEEHAAPEAASKLSGQDGGLGALHEGSGA